MLGEQRDKNTLVAMAGDGTIAAAGMIFMQPGEDAHIAMVEGTVHVAHRGRGLGDYLLHWMEARARREFSNKHDDRPQTMRVSCASHQTDRIMLFEQHGFKAVRYAYKMRLLARAVTEGIVAGLAIELLAIYVTTLWIAWITGTPPNLSD